MSEIVNLRNQSQDRQNLHVLGLIANAKDCVKSLMAHGYTVLSVSLENQKPKIRIQNCNHCKSLKGGSKVRRSTPSGQETLMATDYLNCQVEWLVK